MKQLVGILFTILVALPKSQAHSDSGEKTWIKVLPRDQGQHMIVAYQEDSLWFIDEFLIRPGMLQDRLAHVSFQSANEWQSTLEEILKQGSWQQARDLNIQAHSLSQIQTEDEAQVVWKATNAWDENWEKAYAEWVQTQTSPNFFVEHNISTDCADVAFTLRWIFARINSLPAANHLVGTGVLFSHESFRREWRQLPTADHWREDQRFMAALNYLQENTFTHTLLGDTYPVEINHNTFIAGGIHLNIFGETGHTYFVHRVNTQGEATPLLVMSSTVPRAVRYLYEESYSVSWQPLSDEGGLRRMRWPVKNAIDKWELVEPSSMPWFSQEQYSVEFMAGSRYFYQAVNRRLNPNTNAEAELNARIATLYQKVYERIDIVRRGFEICKLEDCRPGSNNWEAWSTPARDLRIVDLFEQIEDLVAKNGHRFPQLQEIWERNQERTYFNIDQQRVKFGFILRQFKSGRCSYDPRDPIHKRWGLSLIIGAQ